MTTTLLTGDWLERDRNAAILHFSGKRKVLSTGALNGGMQKNLCTVYNHNDCPRAGVYCEMQGKTMAEHQENIAQALGLDPKTTTGMHTGANIDNTAIRAIKFDGFSVTAIVTAGVGVNACRVGNTATLHENSDGVCLLGGTINIILLIDADLTDHCMTRALVTCTEAKVAALQELMVSDRYSPGLATGSGTDGTVIISNSMSQTKLSEAGESFKLGEMIGKSVMQAVREALFRQSGLNSGVQHNVFCRMERFGVTEVAVWEAYSSSGFIAVERAVFAVMMEKMATDGSIVTFCSLYAHLIDQMRWGLLLPQEAIDAGNHLLALMNKHHATENYCETQHSEDKDQLMENMAAALIKTIVDWVAVSA